MRLVAGTRLASYEILSLLGVGGMGEVYRARDARLGRDVALKVLPEALARDAARLARFEREARAVAALNHPNAVVLYSIEEHDGTRFLTMELVEGERLDRRVVPEGLQLPQILDIAVQLADVLVAAHGKGVIHRDLKPGNIMLTREGRVKVLDFGLATAPLSQQVLEQHRVEPGLPEPAPEPGASQTLTTDASISVEGQILGTTAYMSPEQLRGEPADTRTDIFAIGVILYELATGRRPFTGSSIMEIGSSILRDTPERLGRLRPDLPIEFEQTVSRCLEKDPRNRYQSASDVGAILRRMAKELDRSAATATASAPTTAPSRAASIAVLPFVNRTKDPEDEYFSDGLADELLGVLARIRGLHVAARTSSFHFKGKDTTIAQIGQALNVETVLEGSVRKAGNRVRISVQLAKVSDGYQLWSDTYDRTLDDIFAVQDDIAQSVVKELRRTFLGVLDDSDAGHQAKVEVAAAVRGRGHDPEAHRLYLQGKYFIDRMNREDLERGIGYLQDALKVDPGHFHAWVALATANSRAANSGAVAREVGYGRAREAVNRALALEPNMPDAHATLGWLQMLYDQDWKGAAASYQRALDLSPTHANALRGAAWLAMSQGRPEEAIEVLRRLVEQNPLDIFVHWNLGRVYPTVGKNAEAERSLRTALDLVPQSGVLRAELAVLLQEQGRSEEADVESAREPVEAARLWAQAMIHCARNERAATEDALRQLIDKHADRGVYHIALVYAALGDIDKAFEWLERTCALRASEVSEIKTSARLRALHGDDRWHPLLRKIGLEDQSGS